MSTLAIARSRFEDLDRETTLDDLLVRAWGELAAQRVVGCPVCGGEMRPEYGVHARPIGGRCNSCRAALT